MTARRIAVLMGGHSAEREVSLRSGQAVLEALQNSGLDAVAFDPADQPLSELVEMGTTEAVIMIHGRGGEDGSLQGALEFMQIPYTGSGVLGSALAMDKLRTKQILQSLGLPTAPYEFVRKSDYDAGSSADIIARLGGAIMVKPVLEGSSIGMSKVSNTQQLEDAIEQAFKFDDLVLLEQYIQGKEYTVAVIDGQALPSIRMQTPHEFYDYQAKYQSDSTEYFCPSGADQDTESALSALALAAFNAVGASGWGRVDFMCGEDGQLHILEVNTVPGMTAKSLVPMAAKVAGMTFDQLALRILATAGLRK